MYTKNQISLSQKTSYGIMLLVFLSAVGGENLHSVSAQTAIREANVAQVTEDHQITYFQDNKEGAVSFTFDDGYISQATNGVSELNARGIKGTFFLITEPEWVNTHASWATWQSIAAQGHDVASHTVTHPSLSESDPPLSEAEIRWELSDSQATIDQYIPNSSCITLAYPYTESNSTVQTIAVDYYNVARGGWADEGMFLNHYQSGEDDYDSWTPLNFYNIGSMSGDNITTNDVYLNGNLDRAISRHAWFDIHFHQINNPTAFGSILDHVQNKADYWIDTFCNISRYMKERLNSTVQLASQTPHQIKLSIVMDDSLSVEIYNFPLTIRSIIPASWDQQVIVQQESYIQTLTSVMEGSERVIYYKAVPNGGDIFLTPTNPGAFNKSSPLNGAIHQGTSLNLTWATSTGATSYEYCYDTTNDNTCSPWQNNGSSTSKSLNLTPGFTYYWHVRGVNSGGATYSNNNDSSAFSSFTIPCYNLTKNNNVGGIINANPAPNCNGGMQYTYGTVVTLTAASNTGYAFSSWQGDASGSSSSVNVTMTSNKSVNAAFAAFSKKISAPVLYSPQNNFLTSINMPTFIWRNVQSGQTYEIIFATDSAFVNVISSKIANGPLYTANTPFNDGKYFWHVRAYNANNQFGKWSPTRSFTIDTIGPTTPILVAPGSTSSRTPTFKWLSVPSAVLYEFVYYDSSNMYTATTRSAFRKPPAMKVGTYSWKVRAKDVSGNWSTWSVPLTITITGP